MCLRCSGCAKLEISYDSCRNRHLPEVPGERRTPVARSTSGPTCLPVDYYHVVFTLPATISAIAWYNKAVLYGPAVRCCRRDPAYHRRRSEASGRADWRDAGAPYVGLVTHTPSPTSTASSPVVACHPDGERWVACRPGFLPARARALTAVPATFPGSTHSSASSWPVAVLRRVRRARRSCRLRPVARAATRL